MNLKEQLKRDEGVVRYAYEDTLGFLFRIRGEI